ncbi:MAG: polyprenyl synthetase family protein [Acidobacteria bacterium]|nr:polyprenyl synthetase family protein [Acidobacteriota bacterium]
MTSQEIFQLVDEDLRSVEQELARQADSSVRLISQIGSYIHSSGGKRVRPALLLLAAQLCRFRGPEAIRLAAVVEMIHAATLVHDDIIDEAKVRRGRPSVNARWGNEITVLMGDWLYMTSFSLALGERNFKILDLLTDITRKMIEGELIQLDLNGHLTITEGQHLAIVERKTAFLFSGCARIGGVLGDVSVEQEEALARYGYSVGMAFQLVDDLLDFTSSESVLGKPVGSDLKEGRLTLPLIYLLELDRPEHSQLVRRVLQEQGFFSVQKEQILELVRAFRTLDRARDKARQYALAAREHLEPFPPSRIKDALVSIPEFIIERDH